MYWAEMVLNVVLIISTLQILLKVDFIPLSPEEIEKIELQELKHRMEIRQQQRQQKQQIASQQMGPNDFIPPSSLY